MSMTSPADRSSPSAATADIPLSSTCVMPKERGFAGRGGKVKKVGAGTHRIVYAAFTMRNAAHGSRARDRGSTDHHPQPQAPPVHPAPLPQLAERVRACAALHAKNPIRLVSDDFGTTDWVSGPGDDGAAVGFDD